jgi:hypothetical protein
MKQQNREVNNRFQAQHSVATATQLKALGVSRAVTRARLAAGEYVEIGNGAIALAGAPRTPAQQLMAACLIAGPAAVASHQSAAWLWGFLPAPDRHAITVPRNVFARVAGVEVHHLTDRPVHVLSRRGITCTDPIRTLIDLAAVVDSGDLDNAVDGALASGLLTVDSIEAQIAVLGRRGRSGTGKMREALARRGLNGAPNPSVLESRVLRLLRQGGLTPLACEVSVVQDGRYRIDVQLTPTVMMETDGYAYHFSPEQKADDERRRNRLRLKGLFILVYTWRDVVYDGRRVLAEVVRATLQASPGP